ncbi:MAG: Holliday junction branch migration protein RuvA [Coriobacteriia bacterium]|nr:Holliday junction branch migration protein RuvA [Coriobacteriia bacterium]MCL2750792.1 Holliday junction branch migration protein RuvA [Coriobacteriia bacterium]
MIASLVGVVEHKDSSGVVINVSGVGFHCLMSTNSLLSLGTVGSVVRVETLLLMKNETLSLYGFATVEERALFESLTSVSGVGAKFALAILSAYAPAELTKIIQSSDDTRLTTVSGIGKKTAQRIILELQGSLDALVGFRGTQAPAEGSAEAEVVLALEAMGFSRSEIALVLSSNDDETVEGKESDPSELIRKALKKLG